ncbi:MAG TPA: hypothetical protein DEF70_08510 [Ruminococcaceae bacterium]|nr:hypothetical protein [Oscillospiraceae bacterium]
MNITRKKTLNIKSARPNTAQKRKEDEFPERRKEKQPEARKAMPAKRDRSIITNAEIPKAFSFL